jgi:diketogulonate reductase-like aldo/keto reductase
VFSADKVWTWSAADGPAQIERSRGFWGVRQFDLVQVHNLVAWEAHLPTLFEMKAAGKIRHVGITTSEGRRHDLFKQVMRAHPLDFVQLTYNIVDREAEARLLPLAAERGIAVIVNRPFRQGALTRRLDREKLPEWASEIGAATWAQLLLKFILSHPAVTVAIPATTRVDHVRENVAAASGILPYAAMRERMAAYVRDL